MEQLMRDGVALAYTEAGSGAPPLLLVHCWCGDHTHLDPQFEYFSRSHRVVAVDLRGHGASDKPMQDYTVAGFADDLAWRVTSSASSSRSWWATVWEVTSHSSWGAGIRICPPPWWRWTELSSGRTGSPPRPASTPPGCVAPTTRRCSGSTQRRSSSQPTTATSRRGSSPGCRRFPRHVTLSAWEQHLLVWDDEEAAPACRVPALLISSGSPLSDLSRFRELTPQLVTGQTVGAGHFITLFVPEQVNAMIERFLVISLPALA